MFQEITKLREHKFKNFLSIDCYSNQEIVIVIKRNVVYFGVVADFFFLFSHSQMLQESFA